MEDLLWCALQRPNTSRAYSGVEKQCETVYFISCPNTNLTNGKISFVVIGTSRKSKFNRLLFEISIYHHLSGSSIYFRTYSGVEKQCKAAITFFPVRIPT